MSQKRTTVVYIDLVTVIVVLALGAFIGFTWAY